MAKILTQLKNERSNDRLELLAGVMFQQYGGMQGFVAAWGDYYHRAMEQGGFAAFRCFETIFRLLKYCDEKQAEPIDMSDEEIERELMEIVEPLVRQNP